MMKTVLFVLVVVALFAAPAFADWDLWADSNTPTAVTGQWSHGCSQDVNPGYAFMMMDEPQYTDGDTVLRWLNTRSHTGGSFDTAPLQLRTCELENPWMAYFELNSMYCAGGDGEDSHPNFNVFRWTAPQAGVYEVAVTLGGTKASLSMPWLVNCQVLVDGVSQYSQDFKYADGSLAYTGVFSVGAGSVIDLAIGPGDVSGGWTKVSEHIKTTVPEPSSILALLAGMGGLVGLLRKRA